ncbi:unnamed protein product [Nezara viridula]|uniref:Uncharacterized protein n=1 Tax=Nezara viridula TaxID=85310 RepID=A0A9P0E7X7_NEZVI|nr:unnamed protein product [Nezara viridula]
MDSSETSDRLIAIEMRCHRVAGKTKRDCIRNETIREQLAIHEDHFPETTAKMGMCAGCMRTETQEG